MLKTLLLVGAIVLSCLFLLLRRSSLDDGEPTPPRVADEAIAMAPEREGVEVGLGGREAVDLPSLDFLGRIECSQDIDGKAVGVERAWCLLTKEGADSADEGQSARSRLVLVSEGVWSGPLSNGD